MTSGSGTIIPTKNDWKVQRNGDSFYLKVTSTKQGETVHVCLVYYLQAVSVHVELCHWLTPDVNVLDLLRGDVLALGQLEDVLLPVDDFQRAVLHENVSMSLENVKETPTV